MHQFQLGIWRLSPAQRMQFSSYRSRYSSELQKRPWRCREGGAERGGFHASMALTGAWCSFSLGIPGVE